MRKQGDGSETNQKLSKEEYNGLEDNTAGERVQKGAAQATKWSAGTEIAAKLVSPVVNMVLARVLTPEAFGVVANISVVVSFAEIFTDAGFQKYLVQHDFQNKDELDQHTNVAFWSNFVLSWFLWCSIFFMRDPLAALLGNAALGPAIAIASLAIPMASFSSIQMARYRRDFDFKTLFYVRLIGMFIPLAVTVPLALILKNYWALVIGTLASNFVNALVLTLRSNWKPKLYYRFVVLKEMSPSFLAIFATSSILFSIT